MIRQNFSIQSYVYLKTWDNAFIFLLTLWHKSEICLSNLQSEFIVISRSFSHKLDVHVPSRCTSMAFFVLNTIWHLPGLTFTWLLVNQEKSLLVVDCSYVITLDILSAQQYEVVLSATCNFRIITFKEEIN